MPTVGLGAAEPIGMAIEAAKAAGLLLQWWEMRKQTLLQAAQFEERRIPWLTDMMLQWASEIQEGQVRLDTVTYFDREISRFLDAIRGNAQVDVPSTLLLQLERSARAMVRINSVLSSLLDEQEGRPNFVLKGQRLPFAYQPFVELLGDPGATERYLIGCEGASQAVIKREISSGDLLGKAATSILLGPIGAIAFSPHKKDVLCRGHRYNHRQMIETLRIESFKSIAKAQLDLGQVNVFIGANGSGKSNLLEALALLSAAASGKVDQSTLIWRGARASGYYRPMFEGTSNEAETILHASSKSTSYHVTLAAPEVGRSLPWDYKSEKLSTGKRSVADRDLLKKSNARTDPKVGFAALKIAEAAPDSAASVFLKSLAAYSIYSADTPILHG